MFLLKCVGELMSLCWRHSAIPTAALQAAPQNPGRPGWFETHWPPSGSRSPYTPSITVVPPPLPSTISRYSLCNPVLQIPRTISSQIVFHYLSKLLITRSFKHT